MIKHKKRIVILGGGFGGLYTYKGLYKYFDKNEIDITIVNRTNYFLFTPLLHEVATGSLSDQQVVESIRQIIYKTNDHLHIAELVSIDCDNQIVKTTIGELPYDVLVIALGATTNFFNAPGAEKYCMVLKDLGDAIKIKNLLIDTFEKASEIKNEKDRRHALSFAVVGGGPTGVELISEMAELCLDTFDRYYHDLIDPEDISLYLINRDVNVLSPFHEDLRKKALSSLRESGVKVMLNTGVKEVQKDKIIFTNDSVLPINHVIWTAGVKPNTPKFIHPIALDNWGRIVVNSSLQMPDHPNVFAIGDIASLAGPDGKPLPMLAQVAVKQGLLTGHNIKKLIHSKKLLSFSYKSKGTLASVGQWKAVADIYGMRFSGPFAWFLWRTVYLFKFFSHSKKIKIIVDWTMNIFYPRDITKA
jgi:NADH dehydrogenase